MKKQMIEFFAGKKSIGNVAEKHGIEVISLDYKEEYDCTITMNILDFNPAHYPELSPNIIWASPDCTTFSFASGGFYRKKDGSAKNVLAKIGDYILTKTLFLIDHYIEKNKDLIYYLENPRGDMAKQEIIRERVRSGKMFEHLITYCSYGGPFRKPTYIWTNNKNFIPRKKCGYKTEKQGGGGNDCHHVYVKRKSNNGLKSIGRAGDINRSIIPKELCEQVILAALHNT